MMDYLLQPEILMIFATLFALEVVLGVDNIVFISVLCERLPEHQRKMARYLGIGLAVTARIGLVFSISWVMSLTTPLFHLFETPVTGRQLILFFGGLFLLVKSLKEIYLLLFPSKEEKVNKVHTGLIIVLLQIVAIDAVFSIDSVITAVGLTSEIPIMVAAILASAVVMVFSAEKINQLVSKYVGFKMLALLFLVLLGVLLMTEGMDLHINKGYVYFAMLFGLIIELCHIRLKKLNFKLPAQSLNS